MNERWVEEIQDTRLQANFAGDVAMGMLLPQKQVAPLFFYDELGAALFAGICRLPWYSIYRSELSLLRAHVNEILALADGPLRLVELGPGDGEKAAVLAEGLERRQPRTDIELIDVCAPSLKTSLQRLTRISRTYAHVYSGVFEAGLEESFSRRTFERRMVMMLGSNIGNYAPAARDEFLLGLRQIMREGDTVLFGVDLVKEEKRLIDAYQDPLGVTAAFNKNLLRRMNTELGAAFVPASFLHQVRWHGAAQRIEMHLASRWAQSVVIPGAGVEAIFSAGETIWTESSYKYEPADWHAAMTHAGFMLRGEWIDEDARYLTALYG